LAWSAVHCNCNLGFGDEQSCHCYVIFPMRGSIMHCTLPICLSLSHPGGSLIVSNIRPYIFLLMFCIDLIGIVNSRCWRWVHRLRGHTLVSCTRAACWWHAVWPTCWHVGNWVCLCWTDDWAATVAWTLWCRSTLSHPQNARYCLLMTFRISISGFLETELFDIAWSKRQQFAYSLQNMALRKYGLVTQN